MDLQMEAIEKEIRGINNKIYDLDEKIMKQEVELKLQISERIKQSIQEGVAKEIEKINGLVQRKEYRVTWRHELYFNANDDKHAQSIWEGVDLGDMTEECKRFTKETDMYNEFIEEISFECVDDDYRVVKNIQGNKGV